MDPFKIIFCHDLQYAGAVAGVSEHMDVLQRQVLAHAPWPAYAYKPEVEFAIAHSGDCIFLKFYIKERTLRAAADRINGPVWEDACVEFFIAFDEAGYYNLEFNCIGTALVGYGKSRQGRELLAEELVGKIRFHACITRDQSRSAAYWELTAVIPLTVFPYHQFDSLEAVKGRANFYKCGDQLPEPHFMSWSPIHSPAPDFHCPEFFAPVLFGS